MFIQQDPSGAAANLIAGTFHNDTARSQLRLHHAPRILHFRHAILAQHIKRPHQIRTIVGKLKTAHLKPHPILVWENPVGINFQPHHLQLGSKVVTEPGRHFYSGPRGCPIPQVDC